jgi:hypothetical protein
MEYAFMGPQLILKHPPETKPGKSSLSKTEFDKPTLTREDFYAEVAAILSCRHAFDAFDDGCNWRAVIRKRFSTVVDLNEVSLANVLVIRTLVGILESAPSANVVHKD